MAGKQIQHNCSDHPNILDLYGICVAPPTLCLVLELAKGGDLTNDLKEYAQHQKRDLTSKKVFIKIIGHPTPHKSQANKKWPHTALSLY